MARISIIFPTFNERENKLLQTSIAQLNGIQGVEIILSEDQGTSRAKRLNEGFQNSSGEIILFHHPRSFIDKRVLEVLPNIKTWGGLTHEFDVRHPLLKFTSWYSNNIRPKIGKILYLDHCIFARRDLLEKIMPIDEVDIFEDTILSKKLAKIAGAPEILPFKSQTSAIRFQKNGIWKQAIHNQILKLKYWLGSDLTKMNKGYEKNLNLNARYKD